MAPVRGTTCSRKFTFFDCRRLRTPDQVAGGEGDMVEAAGVVELLLGAAHHDALARLALAQQVHGGDAAGIEPVAREAERRAVAVLQAQHIAVEVLGGFEVGRLDRVVLKRAKRHGRSPWISQTKVRSASAPIIQAPTVSKVAEPALQLLGHGVDVAEAALQRMVLEDRGGARGIVGEVDRLARLVDGVGRGHCGW